MRITPSSELQHRRVGLQRKMAGAGLEAVLCMQNADLFYFTGTTQSGCLYVPAEGPPIYMVRREISRARKESLLPEVVPFQSFRDIPGILAAYGIPAPKSIGMELDVLPVQLYERCRKVFPEASFADATPLIRQVRMIKSRYEIEIMEEAAAQVDLVYREARQRIREGISEVELAAELEYVARRNGHVGLMRMRAFNGEMLFGHVLSGADSAVPAYTDTPLGGRGAGPFFGQGAGGKILLPDEPVLVDFAGSLDGYLVDQTRVFAIGGLAEKLRRGFEDMCRLQAHMTTLTRTFPSWDSLYRSCLALAVEMGYADHFMGARGAQVSFIGHGIGVEIDEYPFIARGFEEMRLEPGMTFAFEPKLVFPGEGAVGIEDTFHVEEDGSLRRLTRSPEELVILC